MCILNALVMLCVTDDAWLDHVFDHLFLSFDQYNKFQCMCVYVRVKVHAYACVRAQVYII